MEDNEIIVDKNLKIVYCDNIVDNGRVYRALASQIIDRKYFDLISEDIFTRITRNFSTSSEDDIFGIELIYNKHHMMVAEYEFSYNKIRGMELEYIDMNQTAIDIIVREEGSYIEPDRNVISKELALKMYNKFKEVFGCK
jgi:hypothetical protein